MSRIDFEQALGEEFGNGLCLPLPFEDASPHECYEVIACVLGDKIMPDRLSAVTDGQVALLAARFGEYSRPTRQRASTCERRSAGRVSTGHRARSSGQLPGSLWRRKRPAK
ncbi:MULTISPECIES: hypothetical protein [unclassified Ensifer]|uniref:hypothetical protein n=1 Tax=unclassified Ensifer TaxID=2633371 RepID=UPI000812CFB4|nr:MULTISPECIES: hypothetical protein [unclassified Ensifer]OCP01050.1 hypothetical protein BBX50_07795 [Ensifer sp. LC11]OCP01624.1 hypothetical protein BC374_07855 [Ensifer sp. LC13]OCP02172.1 hypothetical protein BC362_20755 [Ensifer sp. LC14]OCP29996.1 hypothetical protein BC364_06405 [Ensifer sp. LC499]